MAEIKFKGICSGTQAKTSAKGNAYQVTTFVELPSLKTFDVFGNLGLVAHDTPVEYVLQGSITANGLSNVTVVSPAPASAKK